MYAAVCLPSGVIPSGYEKKALAASDLDDCSSQSPRSDLKSVGSTVLPESPLTQSTGSIFSFGSRSWTEDTLESTHDIALHKDAILDNGDQDERDVKQDECDAFLREMAGSFEATYDDEESDEETEGKVEHCTASDSSDASGEKTGELDQGAYEAFPNDVAGSYKQQASDDKESQAGSDLGLGDHEQVHSSQPACNPGMQFFGQKPVGQVPASPLWAGDTVYARLATGELKHLDERAPVQDSYDMVTAAGPLDPPSLELPPAMAPFGVKARRAALEDTIRLRKEQASRLWAVSRKPHLSASLRSQYARFGDEFMEEMKSLQQELEFLLAEYC